jgi:peroxiredoxin Q/BCP
MIAAGNKAPAFALESSAGGTVKLADLAGKTAVLYFYPRDNTPGCTIEAQDFQAALPALAKAGAVVYGVSKDSIASHGKFAGKFGLTFPLLSDPDGKVLEAYGAWGEKSMYGKKMLGIIRSTVVIGPDGKIARHWPKVSVKGHAAEVVDTVQALTSGATPAAKSLPAKAGAKAKVSKPAKPAAKAKPKK